MKVWCVILTLITTLSWGQDRQEIYSYFPPEEGYDIGSVMFITRKRIHPPFLTPSDTTFKLEITETRKDTAKIEKSIEVFNGKKRSTSTKRYNLVKTNIVGIGRTVRTIKGGHAQFSNYLRSLSTQNANNVYPYFRKLRKPWVIIEAVKFKKGSYQFQFDKALHDSIEVTHGNFFIYTSTNKELVEATYENQFVQYIKRKITSEEYNIIKDKFYENRRLSSINFANYPSLLFVKNMAEDLHIAPQFLWMQAIDMEFHTRSYRFFSLGFAYLFPYRVDIDNYFNTIISNYDGRVTVTYTVSAYQASLKYLMWDGQSIVRPHVSVIGNFQKIQPSKISSKELDKEQLDQLTSNNLKSTSVGFGLGVDVLIGKDKSLDKRVVLSLDGNLFNSRIQREAYTFNPFGDADVKRSSPSVTNLQLALGVSYRIARW